MIDGFCAVDYHVHSSRSHDCAASIADMCRRAYEIGVSEIGFAEHKDFDPDDPVVDFFDYDAFMADVDASRAHYGGALKIRAGIEIDYQQWLEDRIANYLDAHPVDFLIGSVHSIRGVVVTSQEYRRTRNRSTAYKDYFEEVRASVRAGLFDIVGHLEYANRRGSDAWGPYDPAMFADELEELFDLMADRSVALELNSAGTRHGLQTTYPGPSTLAIYTARGCDLIAFGSDAHTPEEIAHGYAQLARTAIDAGHSHVCVWENRQRTKIPIVTQAQQPSA
jgi:histidinol-phosphatase (PHP family)